jgi:hypothetical protein
MRELIALRAKSVGALIDELDTNLASPNWVRFAETEVTVLVLFLTPRHLNIGSRHKCDSLLRAFFLSDSALRS